MLQQPPLPWTSETPPHFDAAEDAWIVCSYADVENVLLGAYDFSWEVRDRNADPVFAGMWNADGQRHDDLRRLVQPYFQPRRILAMQAQIEDIINALIDDILEASSDTVDIVRELADPLGGRFTSALAGIDPDDISQLTRWRRERQSALNNGLSTDHPDLRDYYTRLIERRRREPEDTLLDHLLAAQREGYLVDGEPLTDWDVMGAMMTSVSPGLTGAKLGPVLAGLASHGLLDAARNDPALVDGAIEETMRLYPALPVMRVRARHDVPLGGVTVPAGALVQACISTANLDPGHFPEPERFDPTRTPNRHLSFGCGAHHCLGASLVRTEIRIGVAALLKRLPGLRLDTSKPVRHTYGRVVGGAFEATFRFDRPEVSRP
ncbi:cytochrome P450 [Streptomyces sp. BK340]|uniref:cytochrome P450 n=1 Tax=Streptomyces sp. BK340 TaxID=2572903 RepID=UPI0011A64A2F|nr:cytochrome P450 [Streptomyces sp. BK340]TVZ90360.1 cytochrome P450 [Streptomyces sp. BK340]